MKSHLLIATAFACVFASTTASAADDLMTREYAHDEACSSEGGFSLRNSTVFRRGFHSGDVDIEAGRSRFSLWGTGMDLATVRLTGSGLSLRKIDTRNGPHNISRGCPGEYGTLTFELTSTEYPANAIGGTLIVERFGNEWRIPLSVQASPAAIESRWDSFPANGSGGSGASGAVLIRSGAGACNPQVQGCDSARVRAGSGAGTNTGGSAPSTIESFTGLQRCLAGSGGDARLDADGRLFIRVPRDRVVACQPTVLADWRATQHTVDIYSSVEDRVETSVRSVTPNGSFFNGIRDGDQVKVGFNWPAIRDRFNAASIAPTLSGPVTQVPRVSVGTRAATVPGPDIDAQIGIAVNGRSHDPLRIHIEAMP